MNTTTMHGADCRLHYTITHKLKKNFNLIQQKVNEDCGPVYNFSTVLCK
jgi:hypothetical protein